MNDFSATPYRAPAPARPKKMAGLRWAAATVAVLVALLLGLLTLAIIGGGTGAVPLLIGLIVAVLPVPVYVTLVLWMDRYEAEPAWMLATAFFWGALVAVFFAIIINSLGVLFVGALFDERAAEFYGLVISAPVVEETAKALAVFALYFWKRDEFDGVLDGIVYAAMVGLGFAMTENVKYYGEAAREGEAVGVFIVRGMFSPYAHPLFTSMTGIGLGLARQSGGRAAKIFAPLIGFALAVLLHAAWNAAAYFGERLESGLVVIIMYFGVMVPAFAGVLGAVALALRREGRILREHLRRDYHAGLLSAREYESLCTVGGRAGASLRALTSSGLPAWRARREFHGLASELAFHRERVSRGLAARDGSDARREETYLSRLGELRARAAGRAGT